MKLEITHKKHIKGKVKISGSKNASLPLMVCSLLTTDQLILNNIPNIVDINNMIFLLKELGTNVKYNQKKKQLILQTTKIKPNLIISNMKRLRASYYLMGALIGNNLEFSSYYPGGCSFMDRPINYHIKAFEILGYQVEELDNVLNFKIDYDKLSNYHRVINLEKKSVGTTINIMLASVKQKYKTIIYNPSLEPEVIEVIKLLNLMGGYIEYNQEYIKIKGVERLHGTKFKVIYDRIEAGSYLLLGLTSKKVNMKIINVDDTYIKSILEVISKMGGHCKITKNKICLKCKSPLKGIDVIVDNYPSFPTDLQQILTVLCAKAITPSSITDNVYTNRFSQIKELKKADGVVEINNNTIYIYPSKLNSTILEASDLRCGFACILIATQSNGKTIINKAENILRGYESIIRKMKKIGVKIKIID